MKKIVIPNNIINSIIEDYKDGSTITEISNKYKYDRSKLRKLLKDKNIYKLPGNYGVKYNWSKDDISSIITMYTEENLSSQEIADKYGCWDTTILSVLNDNNIETTRKRDLHNWKVYDVNESFFEVIDTEKKAYWLGFLLADGHVSVDGKIMLTLSSKDINHIKMFRKDIDSSHPISYLEKSDASHLNIGCGIMANDLRNIGLNNQKSYYYDMEKVISHIPENLTNHFIRGYFDGDGCIGVYRQTHYKHKKMYHFSILGIKEFLEYIKDKTDINCQIKLDTRTKNTYQLITRNKNEILKLKDYLYHDANIYMNRKHDIFVNII